MSYIPQLTIKNVRFFEANDHHDYWRALCDLIAVSSCEKQRTKRAIGGTKIMKHEQGTPAPAFRQLIVDIPFVDIP